MSCSKYIFYAQLKNLRSPISEAEIIKDCRFVEIRARLLPYKRAVRFGFLRREVIAGMPFYIPVKVSP